MFQICPVCDMQQDIEPYDVCQVCGHEWSSEEIRSSTPAPIERPLTPRSPDTGESAVKMGFLTPEESAAIKADNTPAPARVTQTVSCSLAKEYHERKSRIAKLPLLR